MNGLPETNNRHCFEIRPCTRQAVRALLNEYSDDALGALALYPEFPIAELRPGESFMVRFDDNRLLDLAPWVEQSMDAKLLRLAKEASTGGKRFGVVEHPSRRKFEFVRIA